MIGDSDVDDDSQSGSRTDHSGKLRLCNDTARRAEGVMTIDHFDQLDVCAAMLLGTAMKRHARS